jgi:hypothetical protein
MLATVDWSAAGRAAGGILGLATVASAIVSIRRRPETRGIPWWAWFAHAVALLLLGLGNEGSLQAWLLVAAAGFGLIGAFVLGGLVTENPQRLLFWRRLPGRLSRIDRAMLVRAMQTEGQVFNLLVTSGEGGADLNHLEQQPTPYLEFRFNLVNGSIYPVEVQAQLASGRVWFQSVPLSRPAVATCDPRTLLEHNWGTLLTVRQELSPEDAASIRAARGMKITLDFGCSDVKVPVRVPVRGLDLPPGNLSLPRVQVTF